MKKIFILLLHLVLLASVHTYAQNCCAKPRAADWQAVALNASFKEAHLPPAPLDYDTPKGSMIQFNTLDGKTGNAYYIPSDQPTSKVLIIFHEWWGLNDYIKREADNWQKRLGNVDVYAVDLYDGRVTDDPDIASTMANRLDKKRAGYIVKGMISKVGPNKLIATLGWCFGGSWAFTASVFADNQASGCVMYYGFPEQDDKQIKKLKTDVLYIWDSQDKFIKKPFVTAFGTKVQATGHKFDLHIFNADHAFANPSNPHYNALMATQAQNLAEEFLKKKLDLE